MIRPGDHVELTPFGIKLAETRWLDPSFHSPAIVREVYRDGQLYVAPAGAGGLWWPARAWRKL